MIQCTPYGICSWNFHLSGEDHSAELDLYNTSEQGRLIIDGNSYEVAKHGFASGKWTLDESGVSIYVAQKSNPFTRTFEIEGPNGISVLKADSSMGRSMSLDGGGLICSITPDHSFTRRATITGRWKDFRAVAFGFFLAVIIWRRATNNNSAVHSGG